MITTVSLKNFTVFEELKMECAPGVNIFIGENGTGKTHLLKLIYAACDLTKSPLEDMLLELQETFKTHPAKLIHNIQFNTEAFLKLSRKKEDQNLSLKVSLKDLKNNLALNSYPDPCSDWEKEPIDSIFIPPKEILSNAPGFRSLYSSREVAFDRTYYDIIDKAFLPPLRNIENFEGMILKLEQALGGHIEQEGERFFLRKKEGIRFDFMLVAEGLKKLGLLWLLIKNGSIKKGSVLCWDEPDANLNPKLLKIVASILLELQQMGVQIFLSTHNYVLLKEFDLQTKKNHSVRFHAFYRDLESGSVKLESTDHYLNIAPNAIADTFDDLYDRDIQRTLKGENDA